MSEQSGTALDRRYICTSCESIVRARWAETATFFVGCDCTSVPVVPQMTQHETPDKWRVERPECCRGVEASDLDTIYGERGRDYKCPDCGAEYSWKGEMRGPPDSDDPGCDEDQQRLVTDGGTDAKVEYQCPECGTTDVEVYPFPDNPDRGHVYCNDDECGWIFRSVHLSRMVA